MEIPNMFDILSDLHPAVQLSLIILQFVIALFAVVKAHVAGRYEIKVQELGNELTDIKSESRQRETELEILKDTIQGALLSQKAWQETSERQAEKVELLAKSLSEFGEKQGRDISELSRSMHSTIGGLSESIRELTETLPMQFGRVVETVERTENKVRAEVDRIQETAQHMKQRNEATLFKVDELIGRQDSYREHAEMTYQRISDKFDEVVTQITNIASANSEQHSRWHEAQVQQIKTLLDETAADLKADIIALYPPPDDTHLPNSA